MADAFDPIQILATILTEHGPLDADEIEQRLRDRGVPDPDDVLRMMLHEIHCPAVQLLDDRWLWLPALLPGRVFTHRLDTDELTYDILKVTPDLDPITELCHHAEYAQLADGSPVQLVLAGYDDELIEQRGIPEEVLGEQQALLLAPGTLKSLGVPEGDLIAISLDEQGLVLEPVAASGHGVVGAKLAAVLDDDGPQPFDTAIWTLCAEDPALFTEPLAPLSEIAHDFGLTQHGEWIASPRFDFGRWYFEGGCKRLAARHELEDGEALLVNTLLKLYEQVSLAVSDGSDEVSAALDIPDETFDTLADALSSVLVDPMLAEVVLAETAGMDSHEATALQVFAEMLEPRVRPAARVACRWLRAAALERSGDIAAAERELLAAESLDPQWPLPLLDLARFASDRGDTERGLSLLHRAGAESDHPLVELLELHRAQPRRDLGRNQLCWCGSGRKYKKCHLNREQLPLPERVGWLYAKAMHHALNTDWRYRLTEVGYERSRYDEEEPDPLLAGLGDPLVLDAVLSEGGALADFLRVRGSLLPDDERLLAEQWLLVERSVFEVEHVQRGHGVTVRDVRTGDTHEVLERTASRQLKTGQLICARVVPVGDALQFFGGIEPVALHERDALIDLLDSEPGPVELVAQLTRRFAPPTLTNTEGELLALCQATVRVSDPHEIVAALDETYDRDGDEPQWLEHVSTGGMSRIRATLTLDGDTLRVETISDKRMDGVLTTLARLDPDMHVLDDARRPMHDVRDVAALAEELSLDQEDEFDPDDPEIAAGLDEFIREYETKWLDLPLAALQGHTPRQAADDPTRRSDLIKLLDSFPSGISARGAMDVDRLRAALNL